MGYLGRRIGLSQDSGDSNPGGAGGAVGGGILDLFAHGYFERQGDLYNNPGILSGLTATGGVVSDYSDGPAVYRAHIFTSSGTFDVTAPGAFGDTVEYLVVGGGGAGGAHYGAGGGAGGVRTNLSGSPVSDSQTFTVTAGPTSYTVTVGGGAVNAGAAPATKSPNGSGSYFGPPSTPAGVTAKGGGSGGSNGGAPQYPGNPGGSGGGSKGAVTIGYGYNPSTPSPVVPSIPSPHPYGFTQGNNGGQGYPGDQYNGGGGGIGGVGGDGSSSAGGAGGAGLQFAIAGPPTSTVIGDYDPTPGEGQYFAGGGGGGGSASTGGIGGGGNSTPTANALNRGQENTGGGGAGRTAPGNTSLTSGGSGIVVVRYQIAELTATAKATGGAISFYGGKTIHTFTSSGTFATTSDWSAASVEYIIVAGGGGGGRGGNAEGSGGGGAGGFRTGTTPIGAHPVSTSIQVGAGGIGGIGGAATSGTPSYFGTPITSAGGGAGAAGMGSSNNALDGGSGGGGGYQDSTGASGNTPPVSPSPQGNAGGDYGAYGGGGGGGAGGAGSDGSPPTASPTGGDGGIGVQIPSTFRDPSSSVGAPGPSGTYWVAGGGGGGVYDPNPSNPNAGGKGGGPGGPYAGGGNGGMAGDSPGAGGGVNMTDGSQNTGGGGGGNAYQTPGRSGGSGIVLIAYPT